MVSHNGFEDALFEAEVMRVLDQHSNATTHAEAALAQHDNSSSSGSTGEVTEEEEEVAPLFLFWAPHSVHSPLQVPAPYLHQVRKRHFLGHLYIKCIILPRQARDEHRENSKKVPFSLSLTASDRRTIGTTRDKSITRWCATLKPLFKRHHFQRKDDRFTKTGSGQARGRGGGGGGRGGGGGGGGGAQQRRRGFSQVKFVDDAVGNVTKRLKANKVRSEKQSNKQTNKQTNKQ
eukprot:COSAG06_NODE_3534_length_5216_cov_183.913655_6_plen_233_part_00